MPSIVQQVHSPNSLVYSQSSIPRNIWQKNGNKKQTHFLWIASCLEKKDKESLIKEDIYSICKSKSTFELTSGSWIHVYLRRLQNQGVSRFSSYAAIEFRTGLPPTEWLAKMQRHLWSTASVLTGSFLPNSLCCHRNPKQNSIWLWMIFKPKLFTFLH